MENGKRCFLSKCIGRTKVQIFMACAPKIPCLLWQLCGESTLWASPAFALTAFWPRHLRSFSSFLFLPHTNAEHRKPGIPVPAPEWGSQVGFLCIYHLVISFSCFKCSDSPSSFWPAVTRAFFWIPHAMESTQELLKSLSQRQCCFSGHIPWV